MDNVYSISEENCHVDIIQDILGTCNSVKGTADGQTYISFLLEKSKFPDINALFSTFNVVVEVIGVSPINDSYVLIQIIETEKIKEETKNKVEFSTADRPLGENIYLNLTAKYISNILPDRKIKIYYYKNFNLKKELNKRAASFKIHINCGRQSQTIICSEKKLFDIPWTMDDFKLPKENKSGSKFIIESPEGVILGEGYDNDLFIFINPGIGKSNGLYEKLLQYVNDFYSLSEQEFNKKVKKNKEKFILKQKETFADFCLLGIKGALRRTETQLHDLNRRKKEFSTELLKTVKDIFKSEFKIINLKEQPTKQKSKYIVQFDEIIKLVQVKNIVTENSRIKIILERLFLENPETKKLHDLGDIIIIIKPDEVDVNSAIKFRNTSINIRGHAAPHIYPEGYACFGNAEVAVHEALGRQDYTNLILIIISFLESLNMSDPYGKDIIYWPLVKEKKANESGS